MMPKKLPNLTNAMEVTEAMKRELFEDARRAVAATLYRLGCIVGSSNKTLDGLYNIAVGNKEKSNEHA